MTWHSGCRADGKTILAALIARGHESMFATSHLGHFALVAHLAPLPTAAPRGRVITVGSFAARSERLDLTDLQSERDYRPKRTYGRSKLAQMPFGFELDRRLRASGADTASIVATPVTHMTDPDAAAELRAAGAELTGVDPLDCPAT